MKCDERPGECGNCSRLRLECSGYTSSLRTQGQENGEDILENSRRKRTYRSCIGCRASKTKCSGERPTCERCQTKGRNCVYSESCQPNWIQRVETVSNDCNDMQTGLPTPTALSKASSVHNFNPISVRTGESCPISQYSRPSLEPQNSSLEW